MTTRYCESFLKTLKQEEIYASQYRNERDLRRHLQNFIEEYYNRNRLHSALGYRSPEQFEQDLPNTTSNAAKITLQFSAMPASNSDRQAQRQER